MIIDLSNTSLLVLAGLTILELMPQRTEFEDRRLVKHVVNVATRLERERARREKRAA